VTIEKTFSARERILNAARDTVDENGILGLRLKDIAERANVSIPLIHKYFGDRVNLVAEVLGEMYSNHDLDRLKEFADHFNSLPNPTAEDLLPLFAYVHSDSRVKRRWNRMQILAIAAENPILRARIAVIQADINAHLISFVHEARQKLGFKNELVTNRALALLVQMYASGFVMNDTLGDVGDAVPNREILELMRAWIIPVFTEESSPPLD
jgi:AcrR family transcriptional regulator